MLKLRDYQQNSIERVEAAFQAEHQGVFLVLPTGGGKTVVFSELTRKWVEDRKRVVIVAHRQELIKQAGKTVEKMGLQHGVIRACNSTFPLANIQVVSIDSMRSRELPWDPDVIIVDEAHLSKAERYTSFFERYDQALRLLVSATPVRADGSGFDDIASELIVGSSIEELINHPEGPFLVPPRLYTSSDISNISDHVKTTAGDYNKGQLEDYMNQVELVGDVVDQYKEKAFGRKGVVFCAGVAHSQNVAEQFCQAGIPAEHLDGNTPELEREAILRRLNTGETMIVTNAAVLCEGYDEPSISYVGLARPTKSLSLYIQMAGRGLRIFPGKSDCVINDHGNNVAEHGHILEPRKWTLEGKGKEVKKVKPVPPYKACERCALWHKRTDEKCPNCGLEKPKLLVESSKKSLQEAPMERVTKEENEVLYEYRRLLLFAVKKSYKAGYAWHKLLERFGAERVNGEVSYRISRKYQSEYYYNLVEQSGAKAGEG